MMLLLQHPSGDVLKWALCLGILVGAAFGQSAQSPVFEVASVKPAVSQPNVRVRSSMRGGPGTGDAGQITYTNVTLMSVLLRAYYVKSYQVTGPDWLSSLRYDIAAKIPAGTTKEQFNVMLQNLVAQRFHLALHHETQEIQGFELVTGRGGSKLKPPTDREPAGEATATAESAGPPRVDAKGFPQLSAPGLAMMEGVKGSAVVSFLTARSQPISALVEMLSKEFRMPILDKTGLAGKFDFTLEFAPQPPGALAATPVEGLPDNSDQSGPNLTSAVQQQLGLRLMPRKVPVDVLIIDRAEKVPTEN